MNGMPRGVREPRGASRDDSAAEKGGGSGSPASIRSREGRLICALVAAAGLRTLLLALAFPFFANVDEHRHVDMALKYARGYVPRPGDDAYEPAMGALLAVYGSPEYHAEGRSDRAVAPPVWEAPPSVLVDRVRRNEQLLSRGPNLEAFQSPGYYAPAGAWLALGRMLGLGPGRDLYWLRALNAVAAAALVLASWSLLREPYREEPLVRLGVPILLACFPLDTLYYATSDALSPLTAGLCFLLTARLASQPDRGAAAYAAVGALAAAAVLVKYTNIAVLVPLAVVSVRLALRHPELGRRLLWLWGVGGLPIGLWLLRNLLLFGSLTATERKLEIMGWGRKPFAEWGDHPLFTASGLATFVRDLVPLFWRGELVWHREVLAWPPADALYLISTLLFCVLAAFGLRARRAADARRTEALGLAATLAGVGVLALLSLMFVFHERSNPPAHHPYFVHGRLASGVLVPFLLLYVRGIAVATRALPPRAAAVAGWATLLLVAGVALCSELALSRPVFASPYNYFHLPD